MHFFNYFIKCIFDYVVVIVFLPFWSLLLILIAIIIKLKERNFPIFFMQPRVGRNGRLFKMIKFRTMVPNKGINTITTSDDDRITPIGKFLRKTKLDEIPELINILKGEMSLVGPRPDVSGYADNLLGEQRLILKLKPGITGPASLKYSNEEELLSKVENPKWYNDQVIFPDKVKINMDYYYKSNIMLDLKLIIFTIIRKKI